MKARDALKVMGLSTALAAPSIAADTSSPAAGVDTAVALIQDAVKACAPKNVKEIMVTEYDRQVKNPEVNVLAHEAQLQVFVPNMGIKECISEKLKLSMPQSDWSEDVMKKIIKDEEGTLRVGLVVTEKPKARASRDEVEAAFDAEIDKIYQATPGAVLANASAVEYADAEVCGQHFWSAKNIYRSTPALENCSHTITSYGVVVCQTRCFPSRDESSASVHVQCADTGLRQPTTPEDYWDVFWTKPAINLSGHTVRVK